MDGEEYMTSELKIRLKYLGLLMAVKTKYPNETRYETALRYIKQAENKAVSSKGKNDS
jgi:hypothetical protein